MYSGSACYPLLWLLASQRQISIDIATNLLSNICNVKILTCCFAYSGLNGCFQEANIYIQ